MSLAVSSHDNQPVAKPPRQFLRPLTSHDCADEDDPHKVHALSPGSSSSEDHCGSRYQSVAQRFQQLLLDLLAADQVCMRVRVCAGVRACAFVHAFVQYQPTGGSKFPQLC